MKKLLLVALIGLSISAHAITARSYIVTDMEGHTLLEQNADERRSIASITKLFVAEQAIKLNPNEKLTVERADLKAGHMRSTPLRAGGEYTRAQLTELALVSSDNVAAITLGRSDPPATELATLVESSGLNPQNQSTARELAEAARELYKTDIGQISTRTHTELGDRHSTNPLLDKAGWLFYLSKTGFINQSGGCLVVVLKIKEQLMTVALLGASNTKERWQDLIELRRKLGDTNFYVPIKVTRVRHHRKS